MINILYNLYFKSKKVTIFGKVDFWVRTFALLIRNVMPLYYRLTGPFVTLNKSTYNNPPVIVSLTSYSGRINIVWQSIESIFRQSYKPQKVILWLGSENIPDLEHIPLSLKKLMSRGLQIEFRSDIKPHTKYYYAIKEYQDTLVLTVDDDIIYPSDMIQNLITFHKRYPDSIICNGARLIKSEQNGFAKYKEWTNWYTSRIESVARYDLLPLGVMGVLYPPRALNEYVFNVESIRRLCLNADDLWLKAMALKQQTSSVLTNSYSRPFVEVKNSQSTSLMATNLWQDKNDQQINAIDKELNVFQDFMKLNAKC